MVSPNLMKRVEENRALSINDNAKKLFQVIYSEQNKKDDWDENTPRIRVSALISRLSFFYEKIRNAIDYDEEHLLRKNAIARILRRQIMIEGAVKTTDSGNIAKHLLIELIRGSYLPNGRLPESAIEEVEGILSKYILLKEELDLRFNPEWSLSADINLTKETLQIKNRLNAWIINLAACEIEEHLGPNRVQDVIVDNLFSILSKKVKLPLDLSYEEDRDIQIYLSISRKFLKFDEDMLSFVLFKYYNGGWKDLFVTTSDQAVKQEKISTIAASLMELKTTIDKQLYHPLSRQLDKIVRRYALYFNILAETVADDPVKVYSELQKGEKGFVLAIYKICNRKYQKTKRRLWRAAIRSIIYIFLTKSIFVFLIEVPAINLFGEPINTVSLAINVAFPAALLFIIVFLTRKPGDNNTAKIVDGIKEVINTNTNSSQSIILRTPAQRTFFKDALFNLLYISAFCVSIYAVIRALTFIDFNWVSIIIFLFFLAFVSFFSVRTTKGLKDLIVVERRENIFTLFLDIFYMPVIMAGRWLSGKFSKINVFIFLFDFIIEAPFKVLVEIAEDWTKYIRERRENLD